MTIPEHRLTAWRAHRTEDASILFNPSFLGGVVPPECNTFVVAGGTVAGVSTQPAVRVAVTGASGDWAAMLSRESYRAGAQGARYLLALYHSDAGQSGQERCWGRFGNGDEGIYFQLVGTALSLTRGSKAAGGGTVFETIGKANWNGNTMSGLDLTKVHRYEIEVGPTGARAFIDDTFVHTFTGENVLGEQLARSSASPATIFLRNTGASVAGSITVHDACVAVHGEPPCGPTFARASEAVLATGGVPILSLKPALTIGAGAVSNGGILHPTKLCARAGALGCAFRIVLGGTLTGASWTAPEATSHAEVDVAATVVTGGVVVAELVLGPDQGGELDLETIFGWRRRSLCVPVSASPTADVLTVVGIAASGTPTGRAALHWNEVR